MFPATRIATEVAEALKMKLFGSSGFRGVVDEDFMRITFKLALAVGKVAQSTLVGTDTRTSRDAVKHCVISGLLTAGSRAYDAGIVPTPTLAYNCREFQAGVMLTASHNPPQYNGIKLWNPDGSAFDTNQRKHIEQLMVEERQETTPWQLMERYVQFPEAVEKHTSRILDNFTGSFPLKVALDCGCGAGSMATPYIVRELGCEVIALNSFPSGFFPRGIEPLPGNLVNLIETIRATGADLGLAHDADADRLTVVDDKGRVVPGDKLLILLARDLGARKIVTTVDASMTIEEQGLDVIRTRVGDAYVAEELRNGGDFGGEPSGSWIFPSMSYCPDGIHAAAQVIRIASKEKLSSQIDRIPSYFIRRGSIPGDGVTIGAIRRNLGQLAPLYMSHDDGLRFSFSDGWLLVRLSGTEPLIRITAEAKTAEMVDNLYQSTLQAIEKLAGKKKANKRK